MEMDVTKQMQFLEYAPRKQHLSQNIESRIMCKSKILRQCNAHKKNNLFPSATAAKLKGKSFYILYF